MRPTPAAPPPPPRPLTRAVVPTERDGVLLLRMQTLGAARLQIGTTPLGLNAGMLFALVLRVVYTPGMAVRRATLLRELWPHHGDERRRGSLRQALYKLRSMGLHVSLVGEDVVLDRTQVARTFSVERTSSTFEHDVIRGDEPFGAFVPGFRSPSAAYDQWFDATREGVHADVRRVLVDQLRARRERADWGGAEALARWLLPFDPLNEDATLTLAECTMLSGAKAEAVAILDRYLAELGPTAGDIRLPATQLRKRFTEPGAKRRPSLASMERHFVGRQEELADLTLAMRRARWHDGSAVLLHGPAGIGKTRVLGELSKVAQIEGYLELCLECRESDQRRPLGVVLDLLPELLASPGALGCSPESLGLLKRLEGSDGGPSDQADYLTAGLDRADLILRAIRTSSARLAMVDLIAAISDERPIFLSIDDTHWIDQFSWELLCDLLDRASSIRLFVVMTSRTPNVVEDSEASLPRSLISRRIEPLSLDQTRHLARAISEDLVAILPANIEEWMVHASEGTPLMLRALLEHWSITGESGGIPPTLAALVEHRLDRLSSAALRALQTIILLGRFATLDRLRSTLSLSTTDLLSALDQLDALHCLSSDAANQISTHDLIGQAAKRRIAPIVEAAIRSTVSSVLEAEHALTGERDVLLESLSQLQGSAGPDSVLAFILKHESNLCSYGRPQEVLTALRTAEASQTTPRRDRRISRVAARLEADRGEFERSLRELSGEQVAIETALDEAGDVEDRLSMIEAAYRMDAIVDRRVLGAAAARVVSDRSIRFDVRVRAADIGLLIAGNTCDAQLANACYTPLDQQEREPFNDDSTNRVAILYHVPFGDMDAALRVAEHSTRRSPLAPSTGAIAELGRAAYVYRICGQTERAIEYFSKARDMAFEADVPRLAEYPSWQLAQIALESGEMDAAVRLTAALCNLTSATAEASADTFVDCQLCLLHLTLGEIGEARRLLGAIHLRMPKIAPLRAHAYTNALTLAVELGDPEWEPDAALLEVALERFKRTSTFCASDLLAAGIAESLIRLGRRSEAQNLLQKYIRVDRRERSSPSARLRRVIQLAE